MKLSASVSILGLIDKDSTYFADAGLRLGIDGVAASASPAYTSRRKGDVQWMSQ
ncbi:hypothetical protein PQZ11_04560 [Luminiphilus sp.]|jgi:hypothetical protein|nr:hypothetical protein [Luminiphilus sp.]MDA8619936.1 hypothetical protein [Luminiphilus sp.]MDC0572254.1 hypothetical protein [Luminiphilus sp.]MDC6472318.1 hypothetical protein [Luminiphilus sp.]